MNKLFLLFSLVLIAISPGCVIFAITPQEEYRKARRLGADVRIEICVTNEEGAPVPAASVHALMGMNFRNKAYFITGKTDADGKFILEGKTTGNEIEIDVDKDGWYGSSRKLCFAKMGEEREVKDGRWQPWGMQLQVVIREVTMPTPLLIRRGSYRMPWTGQWVGFDFEKGDWVAPYGEGVVKDFEAYLTWDGLPRYDTKLTRLDVRFPGEKSGSYEYANIRGCSFGGAYKADDNLIGSAGFCCTCGRDSSGCWFKGIGDERSVVARTRVKLDESGNIATASYATIKDMNVEGGFDGAAMVYLRYFFNPRTNDRNLEPKRGDS